MSDPIIISEKCSNDSISSFLQHSGVGARDNKEVFLRASKIWIEILTAADLFHLALSE